MRNLASVSTALSAGFRFEGVSRGAVTSGGHGVAAPTYGDLARFARLSGDPDERLPNAFPALPCGGLGDGVLTLRALRPGDAAGLAETEDELSVGWNFSGTPLSLEEETATAARGGLDWLVATPPTSRWWTQQPVHSPAN